MYNVVSVQKELLPSSSGISQYTMWLVFWRYCLYLMDVAMCDVVSVQKELLLSSYAMWHCAMWWVFWRNLVPSSSRAVESNSNPAHTVQCCNCLLCVKGKVKETALIPHAYLLFSFCLSNSDNNSSLQTSSTPPHLSHCSEHRTFPCSLLRTWQTLLHMCPHGNAAPQICKQPPSGTLWKSAALETLVNIEGWTWHLNVRCVSKASCFCSVSLIFGHILLLLVKFSILPVAI